MRDSVVHDFSQRTDALRRRCLENRDFKEPAMSPRLEPRMRATAPCRFLLLVMLGLGMTRTLLGQSSGESREYQIKAAYLYNFGKYVEWPTAESRELTFSIGVVGRDPFGKSLDELARTKRLGGRPITIHRVRTADDYIDCHILFVPKGTADSLVQKVLAKARQHPCLIVGEERGFAQSGGIVNFHLENNRVRFEINPATARKSRLRISSKLLRLGKIVDE